MWFGLTTEQGVKIQDYMWFMARALEQRLHAAHTAEADARAGMIVAEFQVTLTEIERQLKLAATACDEERDDAA